MSLFTRLIEAVVNELNFNGVMNKQKSITRLFPTFYKRVNKVKQAGRITLVDMYPDTWLFVAPSSTGSGHYDLHLHFKDIEKWLKEFVPNATLWNKDKTGVDYNKLGPEVLNKVNLEFDCSCPADLYYGKEYIRTKRDAQFGPPENRPPKIRNPKEYGIICFDERADVLMKDGTYKNIKEINLGDEIFTHTGKISKVNEIFEREVIQEEMYELTTLGSYNNWPVGVTFNHELLSLVSDKKQFKSLRRTFGLGSIFNLDKNLEWISIANIDKEFTLLFHPKLDFGDKVDFDLELARLLGYYLAEGFLHGSTLKEEILKTDKFKFISTNGKEMFANGVNFALAKKEENTLVKEISGIVKKLFNSEARIKHIPHKNGEGYINLTFNDKVLAKLCGDYCGVYSDKHLLKEEIFKWGDEAKWEFLLGFFLGDGYIFSETSLYFCTTNKKISEQISSLLYSLKVNHAVSVSPYSFNDKEYGLCYRLIVNTQHLPTKFISECQRLEKLNSKKLRQPKKERFSFIKKDEGVLKRIKDIKQLEGNNRVKVYNLGVESEDSSYIVNGVAVHNCKHQQALMDKLPSYNFTFNGFLKKFYSKEIDQIFNKAVQLAGGLKKVAAELGKKEQEQQPQRFGRGGRPIEEPKPEVKTGELSPELVDEIESKLKTIPGQNREWKKMMQGELMSVLKKYDINFDDYVKYMDQLNKEDEKEEDNGL